MQAKTTVQAAPYVVSLDQVTKSYGTVTALEKIGWGFSRGSLTAIMGESGSGKSTFLHCVLDAASAAQLGGTGAKAGDTVVLQAGGGDHPDRARALLRRDPAVRAGTTLTHATQVQADTGLKASQVLVGDGPGVPQQVYGAVTALPGTNGVTAVKRTTVVMSVTSQLESLQAEGIEGAFANLDPDVTSGSLADLAAPGTVALSTTVAGNATIGSTRSLWLGDGTEINPRVVAIYRSGQGFGDVLLPLAQVADHTTNGAYDDYLLVGGDANLQPVVEPYFGVHATSTALYSAALTEETRRERLVGPLAAGAIALFILRCAVMLPARTLLRRQSPRIE
jgi:energy-coupling factor transporter ATP-binding protein EcfA2